MQFVRSHCAFGIRGARWFFTAITAAGTVLLSAAAAPNAAETCGGPFTPRQDTLPVPPPARAIQLFDGKGTNLFVSMAGGRIDWPIAGGALVSTPNSRRSNNIVSRLHFRDADMHVEFLLPRTGDGNSGVYVHGIYELQILNSFGKAEPDASGMGGVYGLFKPLVNAARRPGQWQVYDIRFCAPQRDAIGKLIAEGAITAWLNGRKIQDNVPVGQAESKYNPYRYDTTPYLEAIWQRQQRDMTGPLILQDHDNPVHFRNIWVRPLDDRAFMYDPSSD